MTHPASDKYVIKPLTQGAVQLSFYTSIGNRPMVPAITVTLDSSASVDFAAELNRVVSAAQAAKSLGLTE